MDSSNKKELWCRRRVIIVYSLISSGDFFLNSKIEAKQNKGGPGSLALMKGKCILKVHYQVSLLITVHFPFRRGTCKASIQKYILVSGLFSMLNKYKFKSFVHVDSTYSYLMYEKLKWLNICLLTHKSYKSITGQYKRHIFRKSNCLLHKMTKKNSIASNS